MKLLEQMRVNKTMDRAALVEVVRTALRTKLHAKLADHVTDVCPTILLA